MTTVHVMAAAANYEAVAIAEGQVHGPVSGVAEDNIMDQLELLLHQQPSHSFICSFISNQLTASSPASSRLHLQL
jgi:hypothetical protein